jgi:hypothetical protein
MKYAYQELPQLEMTASPRSQNVERESEHEFIRESVSIRHHKQLTIKRTIGVTALERSVAK